MINKQHGFAHIAARCTPTCKHNFNPRRHAYLPLPFVNHGKMLNVESDPGSGPAITFEPSIHVESSTSTFICALRCIARSGPWLPSLPAR